MTSYTWARVSYWDADKGKCVAARTSDHHLGLRRYGGIRSPHFLR
jgi:hypothetical protein